MSTVNKKSTTNIFPQKSIITDLQREILNGHRGAIIWFTGLSGSGKSTLAHALEEVLYQRGCHTFVLDGDNIRHGLSQDLDFTNTSRSENIRRVGEVAKLFMGAGLIVLVALISPFRADRKVVRDMVNADQFFEIYCESSLDVCEGRDAKGLYKRARMGQILEFTGITSVYEVPENPSLVVNTGELDVNLCVQQVEQFLISNGLIKI